VRALVVALLLLNAAAVVIAPAARAATPGGTVVIGHQDLNWTCDVASGCANQWRPVGIVDVNGDRHNDLVWFNAGTGQVSAWLLDDAGHGLGFWSIDKRCTPSADCSGWALIGVADMNGDGAADLVWYSRSSGLVRIWLVNRSGVASGTQYLNWQCDSTCSWHPVGLADMNGDAHADLVWQQSVGGSQPSQLGSWLLDGAGHVLGTQVLDWTCAQASNQPGQDCGGGSPDVHGVADFNRDGHQDLLFLGLSGVLTQWDLDGAGHVIPPAQKTNWTCPASTCGWILTTVGDLNADGEPDALWWNQSSGVLSSWLLNRPA